jgi:hypothetical protein
MDITMTLSPAIYRMPTESALAKVPVLWVSLPVASESETPEHQRPWGVRLDPAAEAQALARLRALACPPSVIIHEGLRVVGLWRLDEPLDDLGQARRCLEALAARLDGDVTAANPRTFGVAVPGQMAPGVFPRTLTTASLVHARRIAVASFDI